MNLDLEKEAWDLFYRSISNRWRPPRLLESAIDDSL